MRHPTFLALALLGAATARAAIFPVGTGLGCGYPTVQAAVDHAATYPGDDVIRVSRTLAYTSQAVVVGNQTVEIVGGFDDCLDATPSGTTTLSGTGGASDSVLRIESDGRVVLRHLTLANGDESDDGWGGGIEFRGNGVLEIADSSISNNRAGLGGGIYAVGTGRDAELILGPNVLVTNNVAAQGGGGLYVESLEFTMTAPGSLVSHNRAVDGSGDGGGLLLRSGEHPVYGYIGSTGVGGLGAFYANEARRGGAIAVLGGNDSREVAVLRLFATDATQPPALRENVAQVAGGALYLRPDVTSTSDSSPSTAEMSNAWLDGNLAPDGAAIYLASEGNWAGFTEGGRVTLGTGVQHPLAAPCAMGVPCNRITNHASRVPGGAPTDGAIVHVGADASFVAQRTALTGNQGGRVLHGAGTAYSSATLRDSLVTGNLATFEALRVGGDPSWLVIERSTVGANTLGAANVLAATGHVELREVVFGEPGKTTLAPGWDTRVVERSLATEIASLGGVPGAVQAAPRFIDPARGDVRLRAASPAVDYLPAVAGDDRDALGAPRDQLLPGKLGVGGPRDIGAHERPSLQPLVLNAAFDDDLQLWPGPDTSWDATQDANAETTSGAARVQDDQPAQARVFGATQCIHLPGPGRYLLNGTGKAVSNRVDNRDPVALHWQLRHDGGEACTAGVPMREGDHVLAITNAWNRPTQPAIIDINAVEWTRNSSIAVTLLVTDNFVSVANRGVLGWFDDVALQLTAIPAPGLPFADGFED